MNTRGHTRDLGAILPKPRSLKIEERDWYAFLDQFKDEIGNLLDFSEASLRQEVHLAQWRPLTEVIDYLCERSLGLRDELSKIHSDSELVQSSTDLTIRSLAKFAIVANEPSKPRGIGSKTNARGSTEDIDHLAIIDDTIANLNRLLISFNENQWSPMQVINSLTQAKTHLSQAKLTFQQNVTRARFKSFTESTIFNQLVDVFNSNTDKAKSEINDLIKYMRAKSIYVNDRADGWFDRVRHANGKYAK